MAFATLLSLFFVLAGALGFRLGLLPFAISFSSFGLGLVACAVLSMAAGALIFRRLARKQPLAKLPLWLILCLLPVVVVVRQVGLAGFQAPAIHDISTDLAQPPAFVFAQAERGPGDNTLEYGGEALAEQQRQAYPQVASLHLSSSKAEVWAGIKRVIAENNWRVLGEDENRGHIEAVATTPLMAFKDDVVIRIRGEAGPENSSATNTGNTTTGLTETAGTQLAANNTAGETPVAERLVVDMRSVSRLGVSDLGANAGRIKAFFNDLQNLLDTK